MRTDIISPTTLSIIVIGASTPNASADPSQTSSASEPNHAPPLACNIVALSPEIRKHHFDELGPALLKLRKSTRELRDGYEFEFPADSRTYQLLTEWAFQERLCCPFFDIDLRLERDGGPLWLRLTGSQGSKEFIKAGAAGWAQQ
jgi:hypothetical protein